MLVHKVSGISQDQLGYAAVTNSSSPQRLMGRGLLLTPATCPPQASSDSAPCYVYPGTQADRTAPTPSTGWSPGRRETQGPGQVLNTPHGK